MGAAAVEALLLSVRISLCRTEALGHDRCSLECNLQLRRYAFYWHPHILCPARIQDDEHLDRYRGWFRDRRSDLDRIAGALHNFSA